MRLFASTTRKLKSCSFLMLYVKWEIRALCGFVIDQSSVVSGNRPVKSRFSRCLLVRWEVALSQCFASSWVLAVFAPCVICSWDCAVLFTLVIVFSSLFTCAMQLHVLQQPARSELSFEAKHELSSNSNNLGFSLAP